MEFSSCEKKKKLVVMYSENHENPKATWSGTSYSLRKALENYFEVIFVDLKIGKMLRGIMKLADRIEKHHRSVFFGPLYDMLLRIKTNHLLKSYKGIPVLEIGNDVRLSNNPLYTYQDLSFSVVRNIVLNDTILISGGGMRSDLCFAAIERRTCVQQEIYEMAEKVFFMGNWVSANMKQICPMWTNRFISCGGGYNVEASKIDSSKKCGNKVLFVGRDFKRKNGPLVLEAFKIAKTRRLDLELYIAGTQGTNENSDGVTFLGDIRGEELTKYLNMCDIFCMPSLFEAYGLVFAEALTFGLPCIGRNAYEMLYFIEDGVTGYLLNHQDANELADLMLKLIDNTKIKQNVIDKRDWYIRNYSWNTVAGRIADVIES